MAFNISYIYQIIDRATKPINKIVASQRKMGDAAVKANMAAARSQNINTQSLKKLSLRQMAATRTTMSFGDALHRVAGIIASAYALKIPLKAAMDFESAMADISKVVEFDAVDGLQKMGEAVKDLAEDLPIAQEGIAGIIFQGGLLGVVEKDLASFAMQAGKMATAFNIMPESAGEAMAKLSNIFDISIADMERVGDTINHVSNNSAAAAAEIVSALRLGAGAGGRALGLTEEQAIALSSAFIAQGLSASTAGNRVSILARRLTDTAKVTGFLGQGFADLLKSDPQKALNVLFKAINKGIIPNEVLQKMLGRTALDFALLGKNVDRYNKTLEIATDSTASAGSMNMEFEKRSATLTNQIILLKNQLRTVAINIGEHLIPATTGIVKALSAFSKEVAILVAENPEMIKTLATLILVMIGVKIAAIAWALGFKLLMGLIAPFIFILKALAFAVRLVGLAFMANPIGLTIMAIFALIAGVVLLIKHFDVVVDFLKKIAEWSTNIFNSIIGFGKSFGGAFAKLFGFNAEIEANAVTGANGIDTLNAPEMGGKGFADSQNTVGGELKISVDVKDNNNIIENLGIEGVPTNDLGFNMGGAL